MKWKGVKVNEGIDKADPFLVFYKKQGGSYLRVHRTEIVLDSFNPEFRRCCIKAGDLYDTPQSQFLVRCYDWEQDNDCQLIGEALLSMEELKKGKKEF